jgi:hypothetical protein
MWVRGLKTLNTSQDCIGKETDLTRAKSKGNLTYPDSNLFIIIKHIENCFATHANSINIFEETSNEFFKLNIKLKFACTNSQHQSDMLTNIFTYYITMRMRQYSYMQNQKNQKINKTKKKLSKLVKT